VRIDAHHHFWTYGPGRFTWLKPEWTVVARDFTPADFAEPLRAAGIDGTVLVQNFRTWEETTGMAELARDRDWIRGVVGWFPFKDPRIEDFLDEAQSRSAKLRGGREILQGSAPGEFLGHPDFVRGVAALGRRGLAYDLLINEPQLPAATALVDALPGVTFILDHLGKPDVAAQDPATWEPAFRDLARRDQVYCKLSGLPFEGKWHDWTADQIRHYVEVALDCFGPNRLMFGSDWPVCLLATPYDRWVRTVEDFLAPLAPGERDEIWAGTAVRAYRL